MPLLRTALLALALPCALLGGQAPRKNPDVNAILKEVMKFSMASDQQAMAFWAPYEFFLAAGRMQAPDLTEAAVEPELGVLRQYVVIMAQASGVDAEGRKVPFPEARLRSMARLRLGDGQVLQPLAPKELNPKVAAMLGAVQGAMQQETGEMYILAFANRDRAGAPLVQATRVGRFSLELTESPGFKAVTFHWRTPLDTLVEAQDCAGCRERLSPSWSYCAYCGKKVK